MTAPHDEPFWLRQMRAAVRLNAQNEALRAIALHSPSSASAAQSAADWLRQVLPYRFDGARHRILSLSEAQRRGYGACGDATAALAAVLLHRGATAVTVAYEAADHLEGYAHVRIQIGRTFVDAYPEASLSIPPRELLSLSRESVRWPAPADVPPP